MVMKKILVYSIKSWYYGLPVLAGTERLNQNSDLQVIIQNNKLKEAKHCRAENSLSVGLLIQTTPSTLHVIS